VSPAYFADVACNSFICSLIYLFIHFWLHRAMQSDTVVCLSLCFT